MHLEILPRPYLLFWLVLAQLTTSTDHCIEFAQVSSPVGSSTQKRETKAPIEFFFSFLNWKAPIDWIDNSMGRSVNSLAGGTFSFFVKYYTMFSANSQTPQLAAKFSGNF